MKKMNNLAVNLRTHRKCTNLKNNLNKNGNNTKILQRIKKRKKNNIRKNKKN